MAVSATGISHVAGEPENIAYLNLFFEKNLIAHIHVNWLAPVKVRQTLVGGSRKMIVYDDLEPSEKIKVYDKGITLNGNGNGNGEKRYQMLVGYRTGDMWAPQLDMTEALSLELRQFVKCVEGSDDAARPTAMPACGWSASSRPRPQSMAERGRVDRTRRSKVHGMSIPFLDLKAQYNSIKPEIDAAIQQSSRHHAVRARRRGRRVRARLRRLLAAPSTPSP